MTSGAPGFPTKKPRDRATGKWRVAIRGKLPVLLLVAFSSQVGRLLAAAPTLDHLYPVAVPVGTTTTVAAVGKFTPWPPQVWTDAPGISFRAEKKSGEFSVVVSADAPVGPHLVRLFNETGASAPRFLIVTAEAQGTEVEPNDEFAKPQPVDLLPVTINGRLNKNGDVDSYAVMLEAGQTVNASIDAYRLASPVDAVLRLVDARGLELAINHDDGRTLDPALAWTAKTAGTYVLQVFGFAYPATSDVKFTGSDACVYRLHLSRGLQVRNTLPPGDGADLREADVSARPADSPALVPPFVLTGCIEKIGEEDRFGFTATKGDKLVLEIQSASLGLPLDAWLAIQNAAGKELVRNDDSGPTADPGLEWTAPSTGSFVAVVGSVLHRAGEEHVYRLSIRPARPRLEAVVAEPGFTVEPGKAVKIKVTARRVQGFKARAMAAFSGLPEGLTASPVALGETEKEITLELAASAEARPFSGPFQIHLREDNSDTVHPVIHELVATSLKNGVPQGFRDLVITSTDRLWLTVLAAPPSEPAKEK